MKRIFLLFILSATVVAAHAQDQQPVTQPMPVPTTTASATPAVEAVPPNAPAPMPAPKLMPGKPMPGRPMPAMQDSVRGNAGKDVLIVPAAAGTGTCTGPMKGVAITNKSTNKSAMARLEITTTYSGHISKKQTTIDNLAPLETRFLSCTGCIDNPTGQTCTTYKVLIAVYKP